MEDVFVPAPTQGELFPPAYAEGSPGPAWSFWAGEKLSGAVISFDTETTLITSRQEVPRLVLASASDGGTNVIILAPDLGQFLYTHKDLHLVGHNVAFDFWVVERHLSGIKEVTERWGSDACGPGYAFACQGGEALWDLAESGRLHDTMLLDMLVRLARGEGETPSSDGEGVAFYPQSLSRLAKKYGTTTQFAEQEKGAGKKKKKDAKADQAREVGEKDPYRLRYSELLEAKDWHAVDPGFFRYAAKDALATWEVFRALAGEAEALALPHIPPPGVKKFEVTPDAASRYGLLTESTQVRAAIAASAMTRHGVRTDPTKASLLEEEYRRKIKDDLDWIDQNHPELFDKYRTQKFKDLHAYGAKETKKSRLPKLKQKVLRETLTRICDDAGVPPVRSPGKLGLVSVSTKAWADRSDLHPLIHHWIRADSTSTLMEFFDLFREGGGVLYCDYDVLKRTGRMSAKNRIQQIPRDQDFRSLFVPSPGHKLMTADYAGVELRTLAATCKARYGRSVLAEVFGRPAPLDDAHSYTAALIVGVPFEDFLAGLDAEKKAGKKGGTYASARQSAKAINFGVPGGLGAARLVDYAWAQYRVRLTPEEAKAFRNKLIYDIYPELNPRDGWLSDTSFRDIAHNLSDFPGKFYLDPEAVEGHVRACFPYDKPSGVIRQVLDVAWGKGSNFLTGRPYPEKFVSDAWVCLEGLLKLSDDSRVPGEVREAVRGREPSPELYDFFGRGHALTLTGRLRSGVRYTERTNTPFQGLAADGMKLALWRLIKSGHRVVACIHDELLVELPEGRADALAREVAGVMKTSMEEVLNDLVPVSVEYAVGDCWRK